MLDKLTAKQDDPNSIPITNVKIDQISERPELFQLRDTDYRGGDRQTVSQKRVKEIVERWDPELLDPIKGDIDDPKDRERLVEMAVVSNFVIAENNIREQANAAYKLHLMGRSHQEIKEKLRLKSASRAEKLLWLHEAGAGAIERVLIQPELEPAAVELGRAAVKYGMPQETIGGLFHRWVDEYEDTGKVPGQVSLRAQIDALALARGSQGDIAEQSEMLAGFGGDIVLREFDKSRMELEELRTEDRRLSTKMTSCERLAQDLGINVDDLLTAAEERQKSVRAEIDQEEALLTGRPMRETVPKRDEPDEEEADQAKAEKPDEAAEPPDGSGINLFGDVLELPRFEEENEDEEEAPAAAVAPSIAMFRAEHDGEDVDAEEDVKPVSVFGMKVSDDAGDDFAPDPTPEPSPIEVVADIPDEAPMPFSVDVIVPSQTGADLVEIDLPVTAAEAQSVELAQPSERVGVTVSEETEPETMFVVVNQAAVDNLPIAPVAERPKRKPKKRKEKVSGKDAAIRAAIANATKAPKKKTPRRHPFLTRAESRRR